MSSDAQCTSLFFFFLSVDCHVSPSVLCISVGNGRQTNCNRKADALACMSVCTCISCQYGCRCVKRGTAGVNMHVCATLLNYYYNCQQTTATTTKLSYRDCLLCCLSQGGAGGRDEDMKMILYIFIYKICLI